MCGIIGSICNKTNQLDNTEKVVRKMISTLNHRGPDSTGLWVDDDCGVLFGHTRLAILELSESGRQPMLSSDKRYAITFNGEIYNHRIIRQGLERDFGPIPWNGGSDTETLAELLIYRGIEQAIHLIEGMYSIGIYDRFSKELTLVRDRVGEKPLYYMSVNGSFHFASEIKALRLIPDLSLTIDKNALDHLLRNSFTKSPESIYKEIKTLQPGHFIKIEIKTGKIIVKQPNAYWEFKSLGRYQAGRDLNASIQDLEDLLVSSLTKQMQADVPVGALLSGGIDSTTLVTLITRKLKKSLMTFTVGFEDSLYNEAKYAKQTAAFLGTDHNELYVNGRMALECVDELPYIYDEPFADSSQIPTILISRFAREKVKVILSGDGADELFGGYNRHRIAKEIWPRLKKYPPFFRNIIGLLVMRTPNFLMKNFEYLGEMMGGRRPFPKNLVAKKDKIQKLLACRDDDQLYATLVQNWDTTTKLISGNFNNEPCEILGASLDIADEFFRKDFCSYLPNDLMVKVDRATMAVGLESRAPYLDRSIIEYAMDLPTSLKIADGIGKKPLRAVLEKYLPKNMINRPKTGFSVPLDDWIRGPLRNWAVDLMSQKNQSGLDLINSQFYLQRFKEHLSGKRNYGNSLWPALTFLNWFRVYHD